MNLNEYISEIETSIQRCEFLHGYQFSIDRKTDSIAFLSGRMEWIDGTTLDFKEFIEERKEQVEKFKYGYHYRRGDQLIFRYDNALDPRARSLPTYPDHKHTAAGEIVVSSPKTLSDIVDEITLLMARQRNI